MGHRIAHRIDFRFIEYNTRRAAQGIDAVRVEVVEDGEKDWMWMSKKDIAKSMMAFGRHPELVKAYQAYQEDEPAVARTTPR